MADAMNEGLELKSLSDKQSADAFGAVEFVPCHRQKIYPEFADLGPDFSDRPRRVRVEWYTVLASDTTDFGNRLNRTDFVVRMHNWR